jgi:hypothetical protein
LCVKQWELEFATLSSRLPTLGARPPKGPAVGSPTLFSTASGVLRPGSTAGRAVFPHGILSEASLPGSSSARRHRTPDRVTARLRGSFSHRYRLPQGRPSPLENALALCYGSGLLALTSLLVSQSGVGLFRPRPKQEVGRGLPASLPPRRLSPLARSRCESEALWRGRPAR